MHENERKRPEQVFAARVREMRERYGWSQQRLAKAMSARGLAIGANMAAPMHIDPSGVTRLERGDRQIRLDEAVLLAEIFDTTVDGMLRPALPLDEQIRSAEFQVGSAYLRAAAANAGHEAAKARLRRLHEAAEGSDDGEHQAQA